MNLTEFLAKIEFTPYGSVVNSWDSFNKEGSVLMQLWAEPGQRVHSHQIEGAYLRVCCWNAAAYARNGDAQVVGYNGRRYAIEEIERGAQGYAALSNVPEESQRRPGSWAKNADLTKVYPILKIERICDTGDIFAILNTPIQIENIT
jgi:hypothetical protein